MPKPAPVIDPPVIDQLEMMIRSKTDPKDVATFLFDNVEDPVFKTELVIYEGDIEKLFASRLSDFAANEENSDYLEALGSEVMTQGAARGITASPNQEAATA